MPFLLKIGKDHKKEINYLFNLLENFLKKQIKVLNDNKIKLKIIR
jgi:undecaprenyl pyrophosphate synthase